MAHDLGDLGAPSDRWEGDRPPPLERVLLHLIQEYARHAGHLDVVRELADGATGVAGVRSAGARCAKSWIVSVYVRWIGWQTVGRQPLLPSSSRTSGR